MRAKRNLNMAEEDESGFLRSEAVETACYSLLAITATSGFIILRKHSEFKYATSAFFQQSELGFWYLLGKAIAKNSEENSENMTDFVTILAETTTFHFNIPLITAQACFLTLQDQPVSGITKTTCGLFASAPFISYLTRIFASEEANICVDTTIKTISLASLCYVTHQLGYPANAYFFTAMFLAEELSYYFAPRSITVTMMCLNDVLYLSWLLGFKTD